MNEHDELRKQFRDLVNSFPREAGEHVEQRLLSAFRSHHRRREQLWIYAVETAASLTVAVGLYFALLNGGTANWRERNAAGMAPSRSAVRVNGPEADHDPGADFIALPYAESGVPVGEAIVLRVQLPVSELSVLGVPVSPTATAVRVGADVLIGQDGVPRAVRLVR